MSPKKKRNTGYVMLLLALGMTMLCGFAGLALDLGFAEYYKRRVQSAADAGAIGAMQEYRVNGSTNMVSAATQDVTTNGFTDGVNGAAVTVNHPPTSGPYSGNNNYAEVIVTKQVPTSFMRMLNFNSVTVYGRAVGGLGDSPYCILALDPAASGAVTVWGSANVNVPTCDVVSDSGASDSYSNGGAGCLTAKEIDVVGGYTAKCTTPTPNGGRPYVYDPLAQLAVPSFTVPTSGGANCDQSNYKTTKTATLSPGVYCGGITITGSGNTITFNAGTYILYGGGLTIHGGNTLKGSNIMFYNTGTASGKYAYGGVTMNGNASFQWTAPTTGTYQGILFFQDRSNTQADSILGDNTSTFDGILYAAGAAMSYTGNSTVSGYTSIIADTVTFTGNSTFGSNYSTLANGNPLKTGSLSE